MVLPPGVGAARLAGSRTAVALIGGSVVQSEEREDVQQRQIKVGERECRGFGGDGDDYGGDQEDEGGASQRPRNPERLTPTPPARSPSR
jgi:hypothetical protein